ncbi:MAG TPA: RagB/SusD family nutrient uptake outer membrane protein, partial [Chitinophaga sp.]
MKLTIFSMAFMAGCALLASCKKFVQLSAPETSITKSEVYNDSMKATAVVSYIYYDLASSFAEGYKGVGVLSSLSGDELKSYNTNLDYIDLAQNDMQANNAPNSTLWADAYKDLYQANLVMDNIANATGLSAAVKNQLNGECKFIRAYLHFYLVNLYGDIPLMLTADYQGNAVAGRTPVSKVYESIFSDLKDAQSLLTDDYRSGSNTSTKDRLRPNKAVVAALLARVYLYQERWQDAEAAATSLINNPSYILEPDPNNIFLAASREAIWQLQSPVAPYCTLEGDYYIMKSSPIPFNSVTTILASAVSPRLLDAFEPGDKRRTAWIGSFTIDTSTWLFPYKYKSSTFISTYTNTNIASEDLAVFRLAEAYLVRAEARARQGKLTGAGGAT